MDDNIIGAAVSGLVAIYIIDKLTGKRKRVYVTKSEAKKRKAKKSTKKSKRS